MAPVGKTLNPAADPVAPLAGPPGLTAAKLVSLTSPDAPFVAARSANSAMFAFVNAGQLLVRSVSGEEKEPRLLTEVPTLGAGFSLRPYQDGFLLFWDERQDQNHAFKLQRFDAAAKPVGDIISLPPVAEANVGFSDTVVAGNNVYVVYEVSREDRVTIFAFRLGEGASAPSGAPIKTVENALAWHAAQSEAGLVFATVENDKPLEGGKPALGTIHTRTLAWNGTLGPKVTLTTSPTAQIDVEIAALKSGVIVAWTDEESEEGAVRVLSVAADGSVKGPQWIAPPIGEQSLVSLTADPSGQGERAIVAWENVGQAAAGARVINLAAITGSGEVTSKRTRMLLSDAERPDIVADQTGFAALTLAAPTVSDAADADTKELLSDRVWPTMVRLGADLEVKWSEPIRFGGTRSGDGVPDYAWSLSCVAGSCAALAADGVDPTTFYLAQSVDRESVWLAPAWRSDDERPPKVLSLRTVTRGDRIAAAHAIRLPESNKPAVGWVSYFQPGMPSEEPPRGEAPYSASLGVRTSTLTSGGSENVSVLSRRASSIGGISLTPSTQKKEEAIAVWVAEEKSGPQVYATRIDAAGKKLNQKKVTLVSRSGKGKTPSVATHVAVTGAAAPATKGESNGAEGYVVAWVDSRDGNGELYAARLGKDLEKTVVDKRLTNAPGDAADVSLTSRGSDAFIAFSDVRDGAPSDIYFARLDAVTLQKKDDPARVYASSGASRSPKLSLAGDRLMLAWIEENAKDGRGSLRIAEVEPSGTLVNAAKVVEAPDGGSINGLALACTKDDGCRIVLSWASSDGRLDMGGFRVLKDGTIEPIVRLGTLSSGPFAEPSFSFADPAGTLLFFAEDLGDRGRVRQVELSWSR